MVQDGSIKVKPPRGGVTMTERVAAVTAGAWGLCTEG